MKNDILKTIFKNLDEIKEREKEVLILRFGLSGEPAYTLESIGKKYSITRERVRQIVNGAISRLKKVKDKQLIKIIADVEKTIIKNGGLFAEDKLAGQIIPSKKSKNTGAIEIICRLNSSLKKIKKTNSTEPFWTKKTFNLSKIVSLNKKIDVILDKDKNTLLLPQLSSKFKRIYPNIKVTSAQINSIVLGSKNILITTSNRIGLARWPKINPKNTKDKIYYVLLRAKKPLHFSRIAKHISDKKFVTKNPTPATVHNELISDDRFVLIGKGIYALRKWGYQSGTVADILIKFFRKNKSGAKKEQILEYVLKNRMVSKNTILMNLNSNQNFAKNTKGNWVYKR